MCQHDDPALDQMKMLLSRETDVLQSFEPIESILDFQQTCLNPTSDKIFMTCQTSFEPNNPTKSFARCSKDINS